MPDRQTTPDAEQGYLVKIVRDGVGEIVGGPGVTRYGPLDRDTHVRLLRQKLIEEAAEYITDPCVEELADVMEVVSSLAVVDLGLSLGGVELTDALFRKRRERGGFTEGLGMYAHHPTDAERANGTSRKEGGS